MTFKASIIHLLLFLNEIPSGIEVKAIGVLRALAALHLTLLSSVVFLLK